jgi:hypothetical protein
MSLAEKLAHNKTAVDRWTASIFRLWLKEAVDKGLLPPSPILTKDQ